MDGDNQRFNHPSNGPIAIVLGSYMVSINLATHHQIAEDNGVTIFLDSHPCS